MRHDKIIRGLSGPLSVAVAGLAMAGLAACGSGGGGSGSTSARTAASGALLHTSTISVGTVLVDRSGRTIYDFAGDAGSTSKCTGACAANWPPVPAPSSIPSKVAGVSAKLGVTTRSGGTRQLTVGGHPVYTYVGDTKAGQANGQGKVLNGGLWTVVSPAGSPVRGSGSTPSSTGKGYGY
ncbi:COG4315 family predicted lipoprotein [Leekyejoonella antrihumi]|uniref:Lipoprotein with Yx(FWY)xxD motif n=1 Tax=Leekyejoonella antrihumi TaxID=1660198 RepID=A0A563E2S6_9MICO|nr:hypothetical protein [Leekyejoonella antrihumi]TWP36194.1 hypothetical protein FGL98_10870 [Leekyejoonella antrihumi]